MDCSFELLCGTQVVLPSGTMVPFWLPYCILLNMSGYVNALFISMLYTFVWLTVSSKYALRTLRARGMTGQTLHDVTRVITIGRLMYVSPSWGGFLSESDLNRLESFVRCAKRGDFLPDDAPSFRDMAARADSNLFGSIISNPHHVLRCLCHSIQPTVSTASMTFQKETARISYLG